MILRRNLLIVIFLIFNCFVEMISTESYLNSSFLNELKKCFENVIDIKCKKMVLYTERMQISEYYEGNLKCQTSLLGLQSELIRNIYFERHKDYVSGKTIPALIKNC